MKKIDKINPGDLVVWECTYEHISESLLLSSSPGSFDVLLDDCLSELMTVISISKYRSSGKHDVLLLTSKGLLYARVDKTLQDRFVNAGHRCRLSRMK